VNLNVSTNTLWLNQALVKQAPKLTSLDLRDLKTSVYYNQYTRIFPIFAQLQHLRHLTVNIKFYSIHDGVMPELAELETLQRNSEVIEAAQRLMMSPRAVPADVKRVLLVRWMWAYSNMSESMREPTYETVYTY